MQPGCSNLIKCKTIRCRLREGFILLLLYCLHWLFLYYKMHSFLTRFIYSFTFICSLNAVDLLHKMYTYILYQSSTLFLTIYELLTSSEVCKKFHSLISCPKLCVHHYYGNMIGLGGLFMHAAHEFTINICIYIGVYRCKLSQFKSLINCFVKCEPQAKNHFSAFNPRPVIKSNFQSEQQKGCRGGVVRRG